jgi:hypothetical protein
MVLFVALTSGCDSFGAPGPNMVPGDQNAGCDINVQNVHQSKGTPRSMDAKATMSCSTTVTNAVLNMKIEQKSGNSWMVIETNSGYTDQKNPHIGSLAAYETVTRQVEHECRNGTYRAAARGSAVLNGVPSGIKEWKYGNTSTITCR